MRLLWLPELLLQPQFHLVSLPRSLLQPQFLPAPQFHLQLRLLSPLRLRSHRVRQFPQVLLSPPAFHLQLLLRLRYLHQHRPVLRLHRVLRLLQALQFLLRSHLLLAKQLSLAVLGNGPCIIKLNSCLTQMKR